MDNRGLPLNRRVEEDVAIYDIQRPDTGIPGVMARKPQAKTIVAADSEIDSALMPQTEMTNNGGLLEEMRMSAQAKAAQNVPPPAAPPPIGSTRG
jgi:hypothetical protein